jgi:5-methylcytosine-specific restriction endonuclease McrA
MPSERVPNAIRRIVAARARDYCEYCRCPGQFATESFTVEHTKPRQAGGETTLENLAWSCFGCNSQYEVRSQKSEVNLRRLLVMARLHPPEELENGE